MGAVNIIFHEWKDLKADINKAHKISDKLKYAFYPPGWHHDGPSQTSRILQNRNF